MSSSNEEFVQDLAVVEHDDPTPQVYSYHAPLHDVGQDEERSLTSTPTSQKRFPLGPRTLLRALSSPLTEQSPLLFTRRDKHLGKPRHPLLLREKHVSIEKLSPHPECQSRKSTFLVALFNLVATVCGGGVLSLPLVFARAGIIPTTLLMIYGVISTDASLQRLVDSSRTTGSRSYGDISQAAFGKAAQLVTTATLACMLVGTLIAYQLLTRDIWAPVLFSLAPMLQRLFLRIIQPTGAIEIGDGGDDEYASSSEDDDQNLMVDRRAADLLLLTILMLAMPLLLKRELYALRHTCYVGFGSCVTLTVAVVFRAIQRWNKEGPKLKLIWWSNNVADWLFAFPLVALCFFCSYNVLSVHSQLHNPTRERIAWVLRVSMILCFILFYLVGLGGYIYSYPYTPDNIIVAFPIDDRYVMVGRMGYCLTLLFGLPLVLLPCRDAVVSFPQQVQDWKKDKALVEEYERKNKSHGHYVVNGIDFDEPYSFFRQLSTRSLTINDKEESEERNHRSFHTDTSIQTDRSLQSEPEPSEDEESTPLLTRQTPVTAAANPQFAPTLEQEEEIPCGVGEDPVGHLVVTLILLAITYSTAISVPGVAAVWSIFGSSMALFIAFVIPTACYIQISKHKGFTGKAIGAWTLLILSIIGMVVCTDQAVVSALNGTLG